MATLCTSEAEMIPPEKVWDTFLKSVSWASSQNKLVQPLLQIWVQVSFDSSFISIKLSGEPRQNLKPQNGFATHLMFIDSQTAFS